MKNCDAILDDDDHVQIFHRITYNDDVFVAHFQIMSCSAKWTSQLKLGEIS